MVFSFHHSIRPSTDCPCLDYLDCLDLDNETLQILKQAHQLSNIRLHFHICTLNKFLIQHYESHCPQRGHRILTCQLNTLPSLDKGLKKFKLIQIYTKCHALNANSNHSAMTLQSLKAKGDEFLHVKLRKKHNIIVKVKIIWILLNILIQLSIY